jgi:hypothetical protein
MNVIVKSNETETEAERQAHNAKAIKEAFAKARERNVIKAAGSVREFNIDDEELHRPGPAPADTSAMDAEDARMGKALESWAGKTEDATVRPAWATDPFLRGDADPDGGAPRPLGYAVVEDPGIASPKEMAFEPRGTDDGLATPQNFSAPKPAGIRMGDGRVLKRAGLFTSVVFGPEPVTKTQEAPSLADVLLGPVK